MFESRRHSIGNTLPERIVTSDNQFGFKSKRSTDSSILALKEIVVKYKKQERKRLFFKSIFDASKAVDRVNHHRLLVQLQSRGR